MARAQRSDGPVIDIHCHRECAPVAAMMGAAARAAGKVAPGHGNAVTRAVNTVADDPDVAERYAHRPGQPLPLLLLQRSCQRSIALWSHNAVLGARSQPVPHTFDHGPVGRQTGVTAREPGAGGEEARRWSGTARQARLHGQVDLMGLGGKSEAHHKTAPEAAPEVRERAPLVRGRDHDVADEDRVCAAGDAFGHLALQVGERAADPRDAIGAAFEGDTAELVHPRRREPVGDVLVPLREHVDDEPAGPAASSSR